MRWIAGLVLALVLALLAPGCSSDGDDASGDGTGDAATTTEVTEGLTLASAAFEDGGVIPDEQAACVDGGAGPDVSPPLGWEGVPAGADQLAITMVDPDADGFVHWVVTGIEPTDGEVAAGVPPAGAVEGANDTGSTGYFGPCPPEAHTYVLSLHALGADPGVTPSTPGPEAVAAIESASVAVAELRATYDPAG